MIPAGLKSDILSTMKKLALSLAILLSPFFASAHGSGNSLEAKVDGYLIDIGYSAFEVEAGIPARFDFKVATENGSAPVDFSSVFFRLESEEGPVVFAGNISRPEFGETGVTVTFPNEGTYKVSARFYDSEREIVAGDFTLPVISSVESQPKDSEYWQVALALLVGVAGGFFAGRRQ